MKTMTFIGLAVVLVGCMAIYLASSNQRWLARPLPARTARILGATLLAFGWIALNQDSQMLTATFIFLTALMLFFSLLPYLGVFFGIRAER